MEKYPDYYPLDFPEWIRREGAIPNDSEVYRCAAYGAENPNSYLTSIDERIFEGWIKFDDNGKPYNIPNSLRPLSLDDVDSYSMSCFLTDKRLKQLCKFWAKNKPRAELVYGITKKEYGLSKTIGEHVMWFIYEDADVRTCFNRVNET